MNYRRTQKMAEDFAYKCMELVRSNQIDTIGDLMWEKNKEFLQNVLIWFKVDNRNQRLITPTDRIIMNQLEFIISQKKS